MNWTEGALARHSRGRSWNPELAKQRQYFAKARAGPRGALRPNITSISILPRQPESPTLHPGKQPPRTLLESSPHFQHRQSPREDNGKYHVGHSPRQRSREEEPSMEGRGFPKPHGSMHTNAKRKHAVDDEEALDVKRLRLLQKTDWAGIKVQKPTPLHFSARNNLAGNQIWGFRKKHTTGQPAPFIQQIRHNKNALRGSATTHSSTHDGDREVRIMIGSEDIRLGTEASSTEKNRNKRPLRTISKANNYHQSGYFQHSSSRTPSQHHASPGNHGHREVAGQRTKRLVSSSAPRGRRTRLERVRRAGQHLVVESSPSLVHQPVPQRLSQLVSSQNLGTPKSGAFGSTIAEVGHNGFAAVPSSEMSENERWHGMFASSEGGAETPDNIDYTRITTAVEDISPGASNFPVPNFPPIQESSLADSRSSSPSDLQESPNDNEVAGLRRYHHGSSDENDDGRNPLKDTAPTIRFSSPLAATGISLSSETPAASDLDEDISYIQGNTRMTEDVFGGNMVDTMIQYPSSSMASDIPGEQIPDQHERDDCTGGKRERLDNPSSELQPLEIGIGQDIPVPGPIPIGTDAEWINFIFGDDDDDDGVQEIAFREARKEAARDLRPSSSSANSCCQTPGPPGADHDTTVAATYATSDRGYEKKGITLSPHSRGSSGFGLDHTSMSPSGESAAAPLETYNHVDTHTDMESTIVEVDGSITQGAGPGHHTADMSPTPASDPASTAAQPPESEVGEVPSQSFQFARPKTFIGRLASSLPQDAGPVVPLSVRNEASKSGKPKRRSRKKRAKDGRADIRRVPDHDGDPIDGGSDE